MTQEINITIRCRFTSDSDYATHAQAGYDVFSGFDQDQKELLFAYLDFAASEDFDGNSHPLARKIEGAVFDSITKDWVLKPDGYNSPEIEIEAY